MSIANYSDLKTAVASWLNRGDLTAIVPDLITLAEARLTADIKSRQMDAKTTLATVVGVNTVALPADLQEIKRLQPAGTNLPPMEYMAPDAFSSTSANNASGQPLYYTIIGSDIEIAPVPDAVYSISLTYRKKIPALSDSNTTNWLLTAWPNAYLYAALISAQPFIMNDERLPMFQALYREAVDGINGLDWNVAGPLTMRTQ